MPAYYTISNGKGRAYTVRQALIEDLPDILKVYQAARQFMKNSGNPTQWGDDRPSVEQLTDDIVKGDLYVVTSAGRSHGAFAFIMGEDPTYASIDGAWTHDGPYGTIHRIAQDGSLENMTKVAFDYASRRVPTLRCDTHKDNKKMQQRLTGYGFVYCGIIITDDGTPRLAYQYQ